MNVKELAELYKEKRYSDFYDYAEKRAFWFRKLANIYAEGVKLCRKFLVFLGLKKNCNFLA